MTHLPVPDQATASSVPDAVVHLSSGGVSLVLDASSGLLPAVVHWGAALGSLTADDVAALSEADVPPVGGNAVDEPVRVAVLPEGWTGWTGRPGISGHRSGRDWSPRFRTTAVRLEARGHEGALADFREVGAGTVTVTAADEVAGLGLVVVVELLESGLVRLRAEVENTGAEEYTLDDVTLALPVPSRAREVLDFGGRWGAERTPQRTELVTGIHERQGRKGRTGADAATVLSVGTPGFGFAGGEVWGVHTAWSGNHRHAAERVFSGEQVLGGGELLLPGEVRLGPGASYRTPWVFGAYGVGLDDQARRFHRFLRSRPRHPRRDRPVTINVWEAVYFDHDLGRLTDLAERAAGLGVERYVLDDGWFRGRRDDTRGLGDWVVDEDVWPDGLHPLVDRVRELGMEFGLWFEPEMVNEDSDVARAHPEWLMQTGARLPVRSRNQQVLDLAIPEAYEHVLGQMTVVLEEYAIAYVKWDHNRDLVDAGRWPGGEPAVHEQTRAAYRLMATLKERFPGLEIESCSSGGGRVDLGVIEHTDRVWVSDCIDPLERQRMNRWTMQLLPPELLGSHVASGVNHTTGRWHELSFRAGTALFGHFGIEWDLARATELELRDLGAWIDLYKRYRDLMHRGELVRVDQVDPTLNVYGVVDPARREALFFVATIGRSDVSPRGRLTLPGLDPATRYRITPVLVGDPEAGVQPASWWGPVVTAADPATASASNRVLPDEPRDDAVRTDGGGATPTGATCATGTSVGDGTVRRFRGTVLPGSALASAGLQAPLMYPERVVLLHVTAED
ncbi:alpha-galactosidase [Curtobacterium sp. MCBD17_013]|uniref:alpha-galactosidase n=1 Tax=Curtobacterium sp. MCBD17_013 TaxID=2175668 RepID=UPI000DA81DBB|nr:alpha-galactosidase [Curtobacterium sp. MCBD17_013]PZF60021.1 alpha-galactosidase [Curtobacterium sp. MCBD17_013]